MKRFVFSMQKVLDLRRFEQEQAELELGRANAEVSRIQADLDLLAKEKNSTVSGYDSAEDFAFMAQAHSYLVFLEQKKEIFLRQMAQAKLVAEEKRVAVREAMQKVKVLEDLRGKKYAEWKRQSEKQDEIVSDDIVTSSYARKR